MKLSPSSQRIERWLGSELANGISNQAKGWHGPPIPVLNIPGRIYITGEGDYVGAIQGGFYASLFDYVYQKIRAAEKRWQKNQRNCLNTGFSSLSDLISEATTGGKGQDIYYQKTSTVAKPAAAYCQDLWNMAAVPVAGSNGGALAAGTVYNASSTGRLPIIDPGGSDTNHLTTWTAFGTVVGAILLADRLFAFSGSHNSANAACTGVPTRYQDTTAAGSYISARVTTILSSTAHNITITYMDENGNTAEAGTAQAARVSSAVGTKPFTTPQWFYYLNTGDAGVRKITNWATSAGNTGVSDVYIAHALAICPMVVVNQGFILDGINSAFNLVKILGGSCLMLEEFFMPATTVGTFTGLLKVVGG